MNPKLMISEKSATPKFETSSSDGLLNLTQLDQRLFKQYGFGLKTKPIFNLIHHAFEYQLHQNPNNIAIIDANAQKTTYSDLNKQANQLAAILQKANVSSGDGVCLFLRRSTEMVIGILACLKLGAYYIPQDMLVCPDKQRAQVAQISNSKIILTTRQYAEDIELTADQQHLKDSNIELFTPAYASLSPENTAVVIFTSGTTGTPNGVRVTHANLCNILLTAPGNMGIKPGIKVAQILNIAFDMAVWEILGCLGNGGTLMIRGKSYQKIAEQVDVIISTPSILLTIDASKCQHIKTVAVAGEPCPQPLAQQWGSVCNFYNSCGPTETTIINTAIRYWPNEPIVSIGIPTPNNNVYILDSNLEPCRIGQVGEMWAGGDCVTAGYLNNNE
ncbi:MAG: AMP-binding protein, partial [Rhizobiales bacterium]|nr:AMP-binding protein [Hyphomicrobiales bacterium]